MTHAHAGQQAGTVHPDPHPLAGQTVTLGDHAGDPGRGMVVPGAQFTIEDWWDRVAGMSWTVADGNLAALHYGLRIGLRGLDVPPDDEVVYGHDECSHGHLVHVSELLS